MPSDMLGAALAYARMGWKVFPLHTIVGGKCSCGKACASPGKHPRTRAGFKDATADSVEITRWWKRLPDSNIGVATGDGMVVVDIDGSAGAAEFRALTQAHGVVPETLVAATGNGFHLVFNQDPELPEVRSSARDNVHFRGAGGYIVATPSKHISGRNYRWVKQRPIARLPDWLRQFAKGFEITTKNSVEPFGNIGPLPEHLKAANTNNVNNLASNALKTVWNNAEEARIISALSSIPANSHDSWVAVGMALKDLGWQRADGTDAGLDIWITWSETCPEKFALAVCEARWNSFKRSGVTIGTLYHLAQQSGWSGGAPDPLAAAPMASSPPAVPNQPGNPFAAPQTAPAPFGGQQPVFFPDRTEDGKPRATMLNTKVAVAAIGVDCRYDLFHNRMLVAGELISKWNSTELSDHIVTMLRDVIRYRFGFDPNKQNVQDACEALCLARRFDPVLDYLNSLKWDGQPRLDRWLTTYLGAADSEYVRAVARLSLLAAVRRARVPGTKFDQIIVLEGRQGQGKSEAIEILAGPENFSDQSILNTDDRKQQELTEGVWLYEIGELSGLRKTEVEHVKAFASRKTDRARPAYGRYMIQQPRRTVFFASSNRTDYLQDDTGNRRFWPVAVTFANHAGLHSDRDQLWAEASVRESRGESHMLPERLWAMAAEEQDARTEADSWLGPIVDYIALKGVHEVTVMEVLVDNQFLRLDAKDVGQGQQNRAARVLRGLGFERYRDRTAGGKRPWKYRRPVQT